MKKFNVGDKVVVLAGKDKGKTGSITKINWKSNMVLVGDINIATKAIKPTQESPNGGFAKIENPINLSNIGIVSPKSGKASRVGIKVVDGKKMRYAKSCGSEL